MPNTNTKQVMTASELKYRYNEKQQGHFFDRTSMKFFGDTMMNYYVARRPVFVSTCSNDRVKCWELQRKRPVKHGMSANAYFACDDFRRVLPKQGA